MLYFNLAPIFRLRGITHPVSFLIKISISRRCAGKLVNDYAYRPDLRHIAAMWVALNCTPNDILVFKPDRNTPIPADHSMSALLAKPSGPDLADQLKNLSLSRVAEIEAMLAVGAGNS